MLPSDLLTAALALIGLCVVVRAVVRTVLAELWDRDQERTGAENRRRIVERSVFGNFDRPNAEREADLLPRPTTPSPSASENGR